MKQVLEQVSYCLQNTVYNLPCVRVRARAYIIILLYLLYPFIYCEAFNK